MADGTEKFEIVSSESQSNTKDAVRNVLNKLKVLSALGALKKAEPTHIERLPDKVLLQIFSYLHHREVLKCAQVSKKWQTIAYDSRLWQLVSLRPEFDGLQISSLEAVLAMISVRFGPNLRLMELPMDLITPPVLHELASKCPKLLYLTLDFSNAVQLHDFSDLIAFPARIVSLTICLSQVIFLEGFIRRIYTFISSLEILHLIGTYEQVEDEEEEVYEVINLHKLKSHTPNLRIVNLFGVTFVTDDHIESLSSTCAHLEVLSASFCQRVTGTSLRPLLQRCKKLRTLLLEQTFLKSQHVMAADWERSSIQELNLTATDLSSECLISVLTRLPQLTWLSCGYQEGFTDQVLEAWIMSGSCTNITAVDLCTCDSLSDVALRDFISRYGHQLLGLNLGGLPNLTEPFWQKVFPIINNIQILVMGIAEDCCPKVTARIHVDQFLNHISENCTKLVRLEMRWDPDTLRFSEKSSKFIDFLRIRCTKLRALVLADGKYYELAKSNFERTGRMSVVRSTTVCSTSLVQLLPNFKELLFN